MKEKLRRDRLLGYIETYRVLWSYIKINRFYRCLFLFYGVVYRLKGRLGFYKVITGLIGLCRLIGFYAKIEKGNCDKHVRKRPGK